MNPTSNNTPDSRQKRVLVAMSGGVDSSVTAALLKTQGYDVVGIHMQLWDHSEAELKKSGGSCCSLSDSNDARRVADHLEIPFYVINARDQFQHDVVDYFIHEYLQARTPNPCVMCNNNLKFSYLVKKADELNCDFVATGHYAKVIHSTDNSECSLYRATDLSKDQSYFLFGLRQDQLARSLMPLGDLQKSNVRKMAQTFQLPVAEKPDSQEICFIDEGGYQEFVLARSPDRYRPGGPIVSQDGQILGRHQGIFRFTVGQRKGLNLNKPEHQDYFVIGFDVKLNAVIVGPESDLMKTGLVAVNCNWIGSQDFSRGVRAKAKIRSRHEEADCVITKLEDKSVLVTFDTPQRAITPGQAVVFYHEDLLLGGGWIEALTEPVTTKLRARPTSFSI